MKKRITRRQRALLELLQARGPNAPATGLGAEPAELRNLLLQGKITVQNPGADPLAWRVTVIS